MHGDNIILFRKNKYFTPQNLGTFVKPGSASAEAILLESHIHFKLKIDVTPLRVSLVPFSPNKVERP